MPIKTNFGHVFVIFRMNQTCTSMNELFIDLFSIAIIMRQNLVIHNLSITNGNARLHFLM